MDEDNRNLVTREEEFKKDTSIIGDQTNKFLELVCPGYLVDKNNSLDSYFERDSSVLLDSMTFFRIARCTVENSKNLFESVNTQIEKLFTALHAIGVSVGYGIVSYGGVTNLVLCVYSDKDVSAVNSIVGGMLSGIELEEYIPDFQTRTDNCKSYGILSGVPTVVLNEKKQTFSLSSIMRALNGNDYTLLFLAKPVGNEVVIKQISELINIRDDAFAVSKRNVSRSASVTNTNTHTDNVTDTKSHTDTVGASAYAGGGIPFVLMAGGSVNYSHSYSRSEAIGYSDAISNAITAGEAIAGDIQNGFALELMNYADKAIERLKGSQGNGIWQTAIAYSADSILARNIIKACLSGELSKPDPDKLPMLSFEPENDSGQMLLIPSFLQGKDDKQNPLCSYLNSSELGLLCTVPTESVPDFEIRTAKMFPLIKSIEKGCVAIVGNVVNGKHIINNMPFSLSQADLNKHTFICGITGSGKTTTVKKILTEVKKPFLVIESAKKEYRNIAVDTTVYTLGKPEINCPRMNPFYIMPGISPQTHIDYLKDLFNASFSFYGPMPYILEKCLHNIYRNKGWNLTLGFHPMLVNTNNSVDFFDIGYMHKQYDLQSHRFLFPTMQELKAEVERYIKEEMDYEGEVAGNIKTAIKVRLENLCVGAKGYMFNTYDRINFRKLLNENVVFELEGLADDSDKAFCVGLMVIFINEYRQTFKESQGSCNLELQHLLVIEEAHRLLKNVETERTNENIGNPKGKAVEHFTNMIAEMRSYGQGVIVAEQIPSKLAPDVIKNSSNKIIQRIVSADDQQLIANTIGITPEDSLQLGTLETGYALCHKEGMALPVSVKVQSVDDVYVSDEALYNINSSERIKQINVSIARSVLHNGDMSKRIALAFLNTLLVEEPNLILESCEIVMQKYISFLKQSNDSLVLFKDYTDLSVLMLSEMLMGFLLRGIYRVETLPPDDFADILMEALHSPDISQIKLLKKFLADLYEQDILSYSIRIVSELIKHKKSSGTNVSGTIDEYFICISPETKDYITHLVEEVD